MDDEAVEQPFATVAQIAELYLGNVLYALEVTAVSLEEKGKREDSAFYRGIARKLAQAHGAAKRQGISPQRNP
ncbi:MAG: hypothetical protein ACR2M1_17330 [Gemmatimonadaceae bacterium]